MAGPKLRPTALKLHALQLFSSADEPLKDGLRDVPRKVSWQQARNLRDNQRGLRNQLVEHLPNNLGAAVNTDAVALANSLPVATKDFSHLPMRVD